MGLHKIFTGMQLPYPVTSVHIGRSVGHLPELIKRHNETVRELEKLVLKHMDGDELEAYRPTIRVGGCCGMGGRRVDAIKFYTYVSTLCQPNTKIDFLFSFAGL
jgi:calcium permeable stress-gated cation channel